MNQQYQPDRQLSQLLLEPRRINSGHPPSRQLEPKRGQEKITKQLIQTVMTIAQRKI